jgi:hypothetical protein
MKQQPDLSKVFDKHVGLSEKCRVSGFYDVWICGIDRQWRHFNLDGEKSQLLQKACAEHGEQVHNTQWDFTDEDFMTYIAPIFEAVYADAIETVA